MSTEDVTIDHIYKMLADAKKAAGCTSRCVHAVVEEDKAGTRFFTITHYAGDTKDSQSIPVASMSLMEESTLANFLLARHETMRNEKKAIAEMRAEVESVRESQKVELKPFVATEEMRQVSEGIINVSIEGLSEA